MIITCAYCNCTSGHCTWHILHLAVQHPTVQGTTLGNCANVLSTYTDLHCVGDKLRWYAHLLFISHVIAAQITTNIDQAYHLLSHTHICSLTFEFLLLEFEGRFITLCILYVTIWISISINFIILVYIFCRGYTLLWYCTLFIIGNINIIFNFSYFIFALICAWWFFVTTTSTLAFPSSFTCPSSTSLTFKNWVSG